VPSTHDIGDAELGEIKIWSPENADYGEWTGTGFSTRFDVGQKIKWQVMSYEPVTARISFRYALSDY
jgi:hypothetical protein